MKEKKTLSNRLTLFPIRDTFSYKSQFYWQEIQLILNINKEGHFMSKVILICGKICSGKTTYAKDIAKNMNAVILSTDELMLSLFGQYLGEKHDEMVEKTEKYLYKKSVELISNGLSVILDWGFWTKEERLFAAKYYTNLGIKTEWHYIEVDDITWKKYLEKRNNSIVNNEQEFYYIDENIAKKFQNIFEEPKPDEMDVWYKNKIVNLQI